MIIWKLYEEVETTKYNTLDEYHNFLLLTLAPSTAKTYLKGIDYLLKDQFFLDYNEIDYDLVIQKLDNLKHRNEFSKYKNTLFYFCQFINHDLDDNQLEKLEESKLTKLKKYRKLKPRKLSEIKKSISYIKDKKLKLSFEIMLITGLRVSELVQIKKEDCKLLENTFELSFIGKGQCPETVIIYKKDNPKLFNNLRNFIADIETNKKLFYSASYLQSKAKEKGFACHDLRRANAKLKYKDTKDKNKVMKQLRHQNLKTTEIYLKSKIDIDE